MPVPRMESESPCHLLVPFASASADGCRALLPPLRLPQLQALLALLVPESAGASAGADPGAHSLSTPHEQALAEALGLAPADRADGQIPWAALQSAEPGVPQAWFSPCHFQIGMDQVVLLPPEQLGLAEADSRPLCEALAPFCAEDGIALRYLSPTCWHASGAPLRGLACASLDRVAGRSVSDWMPESPANPAGGQLLKRLQSEAQMLFYTHPAHDRRSASGQWPVNGFWVSGAGALSAPSGSASARKTDPSPGATQAAPAPWPIVPGLVVPDTLRQAALRGDWTAWQQAWAELDRGAIADLLQSAQRGAAVWLTLCGERGCRHWRSGQPGPMARLGRLLKHLVGREPLARILEAL